MKLAKRTPIRITILLVIFSGCAEQSGNGQLVTIPLVNISCATANCKQGRPATAYIVYTTSSCSNAQFGEAVAGSTTLSCNGAGCAGTVTSFTSSSGLSTNSINDGFYSICAVLDFNSDYIGTAMAGDSTGSLPNTSITTGTPTISSFADL